MTTYRFLEPLDVLFLRGNKLFGDPGSYGESLVPPWPSVAAGAIRSQILVTDGIAPELYAQGDTTHPQLGTPDNPGTFLLTDFFLAHLSGSDIQSLHPLPADLLATRVDNRIKLVRLAPTAPPAGLAGSCPLPKWPVVTSDQRSKPAGGVWLTQAGWQKYLYGEMPGEADLIESSSMWSIEPRVGVGLDYHKRSAAEGKLFTTQSVAFRPGFGFLVGIEGATPPRRGMLKLGGDGRGALAQDVAWKPARADHEAIALAGRCRLVLTSPGIFPDGWLLPGCAQDGRFTLDGICARLTCAAAPRAETISGWDLAKRQPKPAQRVLPAGTVFWLEELDASPERLERLEVRGLWPDANHDPQRYAEGFNRFSFASY